MDVLGTIPQWITAISSTSLVAAIITLVVHYWRRGVSLRGLENQDEADIRDHYAQEVAAMRTQIFSLEKHYRDMLSLSDQRHEECQVAKEQLSLRVEGLERQVKLASTDRVLRMEEDPPEAPHARAAAHRVKNIIENGDK